MNNDNKESVISDIDVKKKSLLNGMVLGPESYILVYPGNYVPIQQLHDKETKIWNGVKWSSVTIKMATPPIARLILITYSDGTLIRCGFDQKGIMLTDDVLETIKNRKILENDIKNSIRIPVTYMAPSMTVLQGRKISYVKRDLSNNKFKSGYTHGVYSTMGWSNYIELEDNQKKNIYLTFLEKERLTCYNRMIYEKIDNMLNVEIIYGKNYIPLTDDLDLRAGWFSGLFDSRSMLREKYMIITYIDSNFLYKVKLLADSLGIQCTMAVESDQLSINSNADVTNIKYYNLRFNWKAVKKINKLFGSAVFDLNKILEDKNIDQFDINIESVKYADTFDRVYMLEEDNTNACVVSGILMST